MAQFSDDISALWGPADDSALNPGPREPWPAEPVRRPPSEVPTLDDERLKALEEGVSRLAESLEAHRSAADARIADQLASLRAEASAATEDRLAELEARLVHRVEEMGRQMAAALSRPAVPGSGPPNGPEADRIAAIERQLHEGMTRLHRSVTAFRTQSVAKAELDVLRSELTGVIQDHLAHVRVEAVAAADGRLAALEARVDERLAAVGHSAAEAAADRDRLKALEYRVEHDLAHLTGAIEAQDGRFVLRTDLKALWESLKISLTQNLGHARAQAVAEAGAHLAGAKAQLEERLRAVEQAVAAGSRAGEADAEGSGAPGHGRGLSGLPGQGAGSDRVLPG